MNELNTVIRTLTASGRRKRLFAAAFAVMAVLVAAFVWIILIRPAESKSGTVTCELEEHVHTEQCYRYICGFDCYSDSVVTDTTEETADEYCVSETAYETSYDYDAENEAEFYETNDEDYSEESGGEIYPEEGTDGYLSEGDFAEASEEEPEEIIPSETTHIHTDACLALVCDKSEHIHSAACADVFAAEKAEDEESESDEDIPEDEMTADEFDESELTDEEVAELLKKRLGNGMLRPVSYMGLAGQTSAPEAGKIYRISCAAYPNKYIGIVKGDVGVSNGNKISANSEEYTLFKLYDAGNDFVYIKPYGNENFAVDIVGAGATENIQIWESNSGEWQKFKIIKNNNGNGQIRIMANNKNMYLQAGLDIDKTLQLAPFANNGNFWFAFEEYTPDDTFSIEARVIFGDYNDQDYGHSDIGDKDATRYKGLEEELSLSLCYRNNGNGNNEYEKVTTLNPVSDDKPARKDWCYQYSYTWNNLLPRNAAADNNNNPGYYVKANGSEGKITVNNREYRVYYIDADNFGKISGNPDEQGYKDGYNGNAQQVFMNKGGIIYIYLDPLEDYTWYYNNTTQKLEEPKTLNLTMKKRWDGYNEGDDVYKNRPKEKIIIQLQKLIDGEWVECKSDNVRNHNDNTQAYINKIFYVNENGLFANKSGVTPAENVSAEDRLRITLNGVDQEYRSPDGKYIDKNQITTFGNKDQIGRGDRLQLELTMEQSNNVVLTVDGKNNPQHFPIGYYYAWETLPYGEYRVVETKAFYDVNDNDIYDDTDRDTSSEYHYMSFPPSRNSDGILHLQNFTNSMIIDVQKEWFDEDGNPDTDKNAEITFDVLRTTVEAAKTNPAAYIMDKVGEFTTSNKFIHIDSTSNGGNIDLSPFDSEMNKYYYFIKEHNTDGYELINGKDGFVQTTEGTEIYGIDYEDGDIRRFVVQNRKIKEVKTYGLKIQKEWYADSAGTQKLNYSGITPEFKIYQSDKAVSSTAELMDSTPVQTANIKNNQLFELDRFNESMVYEYGIKNGEFNLNQEVFENGDPTPEIIKDDNGNDYIKLKHSSTAFKKLWIKTKNINAGGKLQLTFDKVEKEQSKVSILDNNNNVLQSFEINAGKGYVVFYYEITDINADYKLKAETINNITTSPHLISLTFTPYYYYYIQESTADNYRLINGDANGFVKINDSWSVLSDSNNGEFPVVTAKNQPVMKLDITKKWYQNTEMNPSRLLTTAFLENQSAWFRLYKSFTNTQTPNVNDLTQVKYPTDNDDYFELDTSGTSTITGLPAYEPDFGGTLKKIYYYIQEAEGNYLLLNESVNGFIKSKDLQNYGVSFDMGVSSHQFEFINKPKIRLTVQKEWKDRDAKPDADKKTEVCFMLLRSSAEILNFAEKFLNEDGTLISGIEFVNSNGCKLTDKDGKREDFLIVKNDIDNENPKQYFTTQNRELKFSSEDEEGYVHPGNFEAYNSSKAQLYYYVLEIDDPDNTHNPGYLLSGYKVITDKQAVTWSKFGEEQTVTITNLEKRVESFVMPETGGSGTTPYKTAGAVIGTTALFLSIKSIRRKSGEEINKKQNFMNKG